MATEIYVCKPGQALKEGKVVYSSHVTNRDEAMSDAEDRIRRDRSIAKIAYYALNQEGDFRLFYSHTNPDPIQPKPKPSDTVKKEPQKRRKKKRRAKKKTLWQKIKGWFS